MPAPWITPARIIGATLVVASVAPAHRLLDPSRSGPAGAATRSAAEAAWTSTWLGGVIVVVLALLLARSGTADHLRQMLHRASRVISRPGTQAFGLSLGILAFVLAASAARFIHGGAPTSVDELVQLLHAQALTAGSLTLPAENATAAWAVQNGVFTTSGWASIYPPMHTILLAAFSALGLAWLVGPLALGVATWAFATAFEDLCGDVATARSASLLLACSPFWLLLGSTHLSHSTAAAGVALVFLAATRLARGGLVTPVLLGAAVGFTICVRPWTGLALTSTLVGWFVVKDSLAVNRSSARATAMVALGGLPFAVLIAWWNHSLFGAPFRLGYSVAFGPAHGLGFHTDPWGNSYGVIEALAYTGADVVQLGAHLLESPISASLLAGVALVLGTRLRGLGALVAWTVAGVTANALYWHHGVHMGPRMLFETLPAWVGLVFVGMARLTGEDAPIPPGARDFALWVLTLAIVGSALLAPGFMLAQRAAPGQAAAVPSPDAEEALVFVHGSWASRVSSRLAARGIRRDSIETALRRNDICAVDAFSRAEGQRPQLDFSPGAGTPVHLVPRALSPGNTVRVDPALSVTATCRREARADRFGAVELELLLWKSPPLPGARLILARDMGPSANAAVREQYPRPTYLYIDGEGGPRLLPYAEGIELVWGGPSLSAGEESP